MLVVVFFGQLFSRDQALRDQFKVCDQWQRLTRENSLFFCSFAFKLIYSGLMGSSRRV